MTPATWKTPANGANGARGDAELLRQTAQGELGALGELYDRYQRDVCRVLARTLGGGGNGGDVEDLVQATFLELPKIAGGFDGRDSCRAWLCGVAVRLAARRRRSVGRWLRVLASFGAATRDTRAADPQAIASGREELRLLERALAKLSAKKRDVFVLVELEGLSAEEASAALGIPAGTVRTRLFHARDELLATMKREAGW